MTQFVQTRLQLALGFSFCLAVSMAQAQLVFEPTWQPPGYQAVATDVREWLDNSDVPAAERRAVEQKWPAEATAEDLLDRVISTFAVVDERVARLMEACRTSPGATAPPASGWFDEADVTPWMRANLRLYLARWQVQRQLYDEAAQTLESVKMKDVVDPAAFLFYRMAAYHQLVKPDLARAALVQLLEREQDIPQRFARVARLVERDLASLDDESLDHISRRMEDIRRRLDIGRAGDRVQTIERGVVESLDKLIEEEQQRQQQQQSQGASSSQSSRPMEDSRPAELKAPGRVDPKEIGSRSGWGDLPPKQRQQALEQLGREFPAHYRELIEFYFRDLADQSEGSDP